MITGMISQGGGNCAAHFLRNFAQFPQLLAKKRKTRNFAQFCAIFAQFFLDFWESCAIFYWPRSGRTKKFFGVATFFLGRLQLLVRVKIFEKNFLLKNFKPKYFCDQHFMLIPKILLLPKIEAPTLGFGPAKFGPVQSCAIFSAILRNFCAFFAQFFRARLAQYPPLKG